MRKVQIFLAKYDKISHARAYDKKGGKEYKKICLPPSGKQIKKSVFFYALSAASFLESFAFLFAALFL